MNNDRPISLRVPLSFLGEGRWSLRAFADAADSTERPEAISDTTTQVDSAGALDLVMAPSGGYAAVLSR
jgi:hypothetical protein